jgi:serine protease Do
MIRRTIVLVLAMSLAFFAGLVLTGRMRSADESVAGSRDQATAVRTPPVASAGGLPDLTGVAQHVVNSVTNISSTQIVRTPMVSDPLYRFFFGDDDSLGYRERRAQSLGSGVIVTSDGYVLTNNHVIDQGVEVTVTMPDKRELRAKIVGADEATDIAVLKINATNLPTIPWGDSSKLKVAEWVLAIGNPYQLNQSVTLGIVSALGRTLEGRSLQDFIQTDAAINPGNSGGALVNARGELIGINTAIFSETGGYQGIGFAVPSNLARRVMDELVKYGQVQRGTIVGITLSPLTTRLADELGAPNTRGMVVVSMQRASDAYTAGMRPGDIIVSFNGVPVEDQAQFTRMLSEAKIGSTVTLGVLREGRQLTVKVPIVKSSASIRRRQ